MKDSEIVKSQAIIVGIAERGSDVPECERSLDELERLGVDTWLEQAQQVYDRQTK